MSTEFESFKNCVRIQSGLELEAWDVMLFEPLKDVYRWWEKQSPVTRKFVTFVAGKGSRPLARFLATASSITEVGVALALAEALVAILAGLSLAAFFDIVGRCL